MAAAEIRSMLFAAGLRTEGDGEQTVIAALKAADPAAEIIAVRGRGWHRIAGHADPIFVAPDGSVYGATDGLQLELSAAARMPPDVARGGDFEGWRTAAGAAVSAANCPHWGLGLLAGFAGCLAALAELPTCGVNLSGQSSSGKSLAQEIAVSVWGKPDLTAKGSLLQSARATDNAFEGQAARATGTILALDELAHVVGKGLAKIVYTLAGEVGKTRMRPDGTLRASHTWRTFALFSNEIGLAEKIRDDGGTWLPGMATRFADVDVDGLDRKVDRATIEAIQEVRRHYGHAGPAFALRLIESGGHREPASLRQAVGEAAEKLAGAAPDSARKRAALPFGLLQVAGTLAQALGVLPDKIDVAGTVLWAWRGFGQSAEAAALDPGEQAISSIQQWILERWGLSIKDAGEEGDGYRDAVGWYDDKAVYLPQGRLHEAAGKALKETRLAKLLHDRGFLSLKPEPDRYYVRWVPGVGGVRAFALSRTEFGRNRAPEKKVDLKVHRGGRDGD